MGSSRTLALVDSPLQIPRVLKAAGLGAVVVALTPQAGYALERLRSSHRRVEDYHSEGELDALGISQLDELDRWCAGVDEFLYAEAPELAELGIPVANITWHPFKSLINSAASHLHILKRLFDAEKPDLVITSISKGCLSSFSSQFEDEPFLWQKSLNIFLSGKGARWRNLNLPVPFEAARALLKEVRLQSGVREKAIKAADSWRPAAQLLGMARTARDRWSRGSAGPHDTSRAAAPLLLVGQSSVFSVLSGLPLARFDPNQAGALRPKTETRGKIERAWPRLANQDWFSSLFTTQGMSFRGLLEPKIKRYFIEETPRLLAVFEAALAALERERPFAALASCIDVRAKVVAQACRRSKVPFVVFQHGATAGCVQMDSFGDFVNYQNDIRWADQVLVYGTGDRDYHCKYYPEEARVTPIGWPAVDALRRDLRETSRGRDRFLSSLGLDPRKRTAVYAPTTMDGNTRPTPYRGRSPGRHFEVERAIVDLFTRREDAQLIVKLPFSRISPVSPIVEYVSDRRPANVRVISHPTLPHLIAYANLLVSDYPSATFLEMLATPCPILLCGWELPYKFNPASWHPSNRPEWRERVRYAETLQGFSQLLEDFLDQPEWENYAGAKRLRSAFATHLDDGQSARRLVDFMENLKREPLHGKAISLRARTFRVHGRAP